MHRRYIFPETRVNHEFSFSEVNSSYNTPEYMGILHRTSAGIAGVGGIGFNTVATVKIADNVVLGDASTG